MVIPNNSRTNPLSRQGLEATLRRWLRYDPSETIAGDQGYGGRAWLWVLEAGDLFYLNSDTKRQAVERYVTLLDEVDGDLDWSVTANRRGVLNKVAFGAAKEVIPGFYLYRMVAEGQGARKSVDRPLTPARGGRMESTTPLPAYLAARIRRPKPEGAYVVPGSTPVPSFGDARSARVATLGLNPSRLEFLDAKGRLLTGADRRLESLESLGVDDLRDAPPAAVEALWQGCVDYFARNPYRRWFDQLEVVLGHVGASYYAGGACHLDLVQWATDPTWAALPRAAREELLAADAAFLRQQLEEERIELLLLNGRGVIRAFEASMRCTLKSVGRVQLGYQPTDLVAGRLGEVAVVGWSTNLQSSFGVTNELRHRIGEEVRALVRVAGT
jgi:hypothetical protein